MKQWKSNKFKHISFEEWLKKDKEYRGELGAYCCRIARLCWDDKKSVYLFAVSLLGKNPLNLHTEKVFCKVYNHYGDIKKLEEWYNKTIDEFNIYWENLIMSTYLEE